MPPSVSLRMRSASRSVVCHVACRVGCFEFAADDASYDHLAGSCGLGTRRSAPSAAARPLLPIPPTRPRSASWDSVPGTFTLQIRARDGPVRRLAIRIAPRGVPVVDRPRRPRAEPDGALADGGGASRGELRRCGDRRWGARLPPYLPFEPPCP